MDRYPLRSPPQSRALIRLDRSHNDVLDDDGASSITASSISPGSSISNISSRPASSHASRRSRYDSYASQAPPPRRIAEREMPLNRPAYPQLPFPAPPPFPTPARHASSRYTASSKYSSSQYRPSRVPVSPGYDSQLMAVYITDLLNTRGQHAESVKQFLSQSGHFEPISLHLMAMSEQAFALYARQIQSKHWETVRALSHGHVDAELDAMLDMAAGEWDSWSGGSTGGRRAWAAKRPSVVSRTETRWSGVDGRVVSYSRVVTVMQ